MNYLMLKVKMKKEIKRKYKCIKKKVNKVKVVTAGMSLIGAIAE